MTERRWSPPGVRWRATLIAVLAVGAALAAGTLGLLTLTGDRIETSIEEAAGVRADSLVALVEADAIEDPLPGRDPELLAQVIGPGGAVLAADRAIAGVPALVRVDVAPGEERLLVRDDILEGFEDEAAGLEDQGPYAIAIRGVEIGAAAGMVVVASSLEDAAQARNAVLPVLGVGLPLVLVVVGVLVWFLTGLALRPVERMRAEAGRISALALDRRLPVPEARDELRRLAGTLNEMLDRLEQSAIRRNRFVSDASHELKSPLTAMRTMIDVAGREGVDPELVSDLRGEIERMQSLVADLLFLARHDEAVPPVRREEVDLDHIALLAARSAPPDVAVDTTGISAVRVMGDPDRLEQLVRNLVENACRHAVSRVWIGTGAAGDSATVTVGDDGPGVAVADAERIFERFVRLDESRTRHTGGTGLGLAVARAIAREHGGDLVLETPAGPGATFVVTIPLDRSPSG